MFYVIVLINCLTVSRPSVCLDSTHDKPCNRCFCSLAAKLGLMTKLSGTRLSFRLNATRLILSLFQLSVAYFNSMGNFSGGQGVKVFRIRTRFNFGPTVASFDVRDSSIFTQRMLSLGSTELYFVSNGT